MHRSILHVVRSSTRPRATTTVTQKNTALSRASIALLGIRRLDHNNFKNNIAWGRCFSASSGGDYHGRNKIDDKPIDNEDDDDDDGWIRPDRALVGDQGKPEAYLRQQEAAQREFEAQRLMQQSLREQAGLSRGGDDDDDDDDETTAGKAPNSTAPGGTVDWMKTRRSMLLSTPKSFLGNAEDEEETSSDEKPALTPQVEGSANIIPVLEHVLLTETEIKTVLEAFGGINPVTVMDDPEFRRMGGVDGSMVVTAPTYRHLSQMADQLVRQLRLRKLEEVGVVGAREGPNGDKKDPMEHWMVVDCYNFMVNIQMEVTRKHLNLEALWSGQDAVHRINTADEEQVDAYLDRYPIPEEYARFALREKEWDTKLKNLARNRYTSHHRQVQRIKTTRKKNKIRGYNKR